MVQKRIKTRNLEESRKAILQVAFLEILHKGFQGVSIDDIVKKTPYTKGAFYHHFPTKLDLGYALVKFLDQTICTTRSCDNYAIDRKASEAKKADLHLKHFSHTIEA